MKKRTTTQQIQNAIKSNQIVLEKAEVYNKTTRKTEEITNEKFLESFYCFCESGSLLILLAGIFRKIAKLEFMKLKQAAWMEELILLLRLISARVMM